MANKAQLSCLKIGIFHQIVPPIFLWDDEGHARSAENFYITWPTKFNCLLWKSTFFAKSSPPIFLWDDEGHARSAENVYITWPTKLNCLLWKSAFFAKLSPHFLWDDEGRARSTEIFSMCNWFSYESPPTVQHKIRFTLVKTVIFINIAPILIVGQCKTRVAYY